MRNLFKETEDVMKSWKGRRRLWLVLGPVLCLYATLQTLAGYSTVLQESPEAVEKTSSPPGSFYAAVAQTAADRHSPFPSCPPDLAPRPRLHPDNLTIVTGYISIGEFRKVWDEPRVPGQYRRWLRTLARQIINPIVFFTDSPVFARLFKVERAKAGLGNGRVVVVKRSSYWAFRLLPKIEGVLANPLHPRHPPAMTVPVYASVMAAKYDFVEEVLNSGQSSHAAWVDLGLFRHYPEKGPCFAMTLPPGFNSSCIAMNEILDRETGPWSFPAAVEEIYRRASVIVGGGLFLGTKELLLTHIADFRRAFETLLDWGWAGSEQQALYALFSDSRLKKAVAPRVELQRYFQLLPQPYNSDRWFFLGYAMRDEVQCPVPSKLSETRALKPKDV